jgi:hypothetical protein
MNFISVKRNYDRAIWGKAQVALAVRKGIITKSEFLLITGDEYNPTAKASETQQQNNEQ